MIDAAHEVRYAPADHKHIVQTVEDDLNVPGAILAFRLRRTGPKPIHGNRHARGSACNRKDGLTRYFVKSLNVIAIDPLQNLRIFATHGWADGDIGVDVVVILVVELILAADVLLGVDAFGLVSVPDCAAQRTDTLRKVDGRVLSSLCRGVRAGDCSRLAVALAALAHRIDTGERKQYEHAVSYPHEPFPPFIWETLSEPASARKCLFRCLRRRCLRRVLSIAGTDRI